jgi:subfamily B ATP-binding cassette protein HlyB/CyaB
MAQASEWLLSADAFLWGLRQICRLHRIPFAPELIRQRFPPPHDLLSLQHAAHALGLNSGVHGARVEELAKLPTPFFAALRSETSVRAHARAPHEGAEALRLAVVLRCAGGTITYLEQDGKEPVAAPLEDFARRFAGAVFLCSPGAAGLTGEEAALAAAPEFGFRWFLPELIRHKAIWRDVLAASLVIQVMALATPLFTQVVIDKVIVHHTTSTLAVIGVALAVVVVFTAAMSWVRQYLVLHTGNRIDAVLGARVFAHLFSLPPRYFEHRPTGVLVARVQGVETIREFLSGAAVTLLLDVPFLLIFLAIMFHYSMTLTLITLMVLALIVALSFAVAPLLRSRLNRQFLLGARNQAFLTEHVSGMETVKSLQMEPQLEQRFGDYLASYLRAGFDARQLANTYNITAHALEQMLTLAILCVGAWLVMTSREFTVGMLVAFQMFASRMSQPLLHLVGLWQQFQQADIAVKRLGDIMNAPGEPYSLVPARKTHSGRGRVEIRGVSFRYGVDRAYLYRNFSFAVEPGMCVAVMGPSGSGKSTLAKLLQGFYSPEEGDIWLDGCDIRHLSANELRRHFGVVPQETVLFSGTIHDNLALANPYASFEHIVQACSLAEIHDTIERLPRGYQTEIGEHGAGLSGGQRQRIAIARALLKRPRILIFDEALSGLDPAVAEQLARTINQFRGKVTILFIAHQLPKSLNVDGVVTIGERVARMEGVGEERKDG